MYFLRLTALRHSLFEVRLLHVFRWHPPLGCARGQLLKTALRAAGNRLCFFRLLLPLIAAVVGRPALTARVLPLH